MADKSCPFFFPLSWIVFLLLQFKTFFVLFFCYMYVLVFSFLTCWRTNDEVNRKKTHFLDYSSFLQRNNLITLFCLFTRSSRSLVCWPAKREDVFGPLPNSIDLALCPVNSLFSHWLRIYDFCARTNLKFRAKWLVNNEIGLLNFRPSCLCCATASSKISPESCCHRAQQFCQWPSQH